MSNEINLFEEEIKVIPSEEADQERLLKILDKVKEKAERQQQTDQSRNQVKRLIEALLFASSDPIPFRKIREVTDELYPLKPRVLQEILNDLREEYRTQKRGFQLDEIGDGYLLQSCSEFSKYIALLYSNKRVEKLSHAATEVLAIIAYRGPCTRSLIDSIRGVDSSGTLYSLLERELILVEGRMDGPGRPSLYGVSPTFMKHFGLKSLGDLKEESK